MDLIYTVKSINLFQRLARPRLHVQDFVSVVLWSKLRTRLFNVVLALNLKPILRLKLIVVEIIKDGSRKFKFRTEIN